MRSNASVPGLPDIVGYESFDDLAGKFATFFTQAIESPHTFDELQKVVYPRTLRPLVRSLVDGCQHEGVVAALIAQSWRFSDDDDNDDRGLGETRGWACEIVAGRFVAHLTQREAMEVLCSDVPFQKTPRIRVESPEEDGYSRTQEDDDDETSDEASPLLLDGMGQSFHDNARSFSDLEAESLEAEFTGLNALEIAAVSSAKKFMGGKSVQRIINGIWRGDIVFWDTLGMNSTKEARIYNKDKSDPYARLRVPVYLKVFEVMFFAILLGFYYAVLIMDQKSGALSVSEVFLYLSLLAFGYNELGEFWDAGLVFYATDFWSSWDLGIIATGLASFIARMVGIFGHNPSAKEASFDILSMQALFLVPRAFSILSLHPWFGLLLPGLKEMTKDFIKFLGLVAIFYLGFDTTFTFLARGTFTFRTMNWLLVKVFFGSGYLDVVDEISPILGAPLMLIFVCLTNILLITSLISLLSASLSRVMEHARDEYLFVYSVFVLEAGSNSNRRTYFLPPLNLVALLLRPLRLVLDPETMRSLRIILLKATHWPMVAVILAWENGRQYLLNRRRKAKSSLRSLPNSPKRSRRTPAGGLKPGSSKTASPPLDHEARSGRRPVASPGRTAVVETDEDLQAAMAALQTQVEALSAMIARRSEVNAASG